MITKESFFFKIKIILSVPLIFFLLFNSAYSQRTINFSGYKWILKKSINNKKGPGNNYFSSDTLSVKVTSQGHLAMNIRKEKGKWLCSEIISEKTFGYGTYIFEIENLPFFLNPNVVLGFFTYSENLDIQHNNEIDIEISKWGKIINKNLQYVLHNRKNNYPYKKFRLKWLNKSTHFFIWHPDSITFKSYNSALSEIEKDNPDISYIIKRDNIPYPANEKVRINFWLYGENKPWRKNLQAIIKSFKFIPVQKAY